MSYSLLIPYNAIIIALLSAMLIASEKIIYHNNFYYDQTSFILITVLFLIALGNLFFNAKLILQTLKCSMACVVINLILLFTLLNTNTPNNSTAEFYLLSYNNTYNFYKMFYLFAVIFLAFKLGCFLDNKFFLNLSSRSSTKCFNPGSARIDPGSAHFVLDRDDSAARLRKRSNDILKFVSSSVFSLFFVNLYYFYADQGYLIYDSLKLNLILIVVLVTIFSFIKYMAINYLISVSNVYEVPEVSEFHCVSMDKLVDKSGIISKYYIFMSLLSATLLINSHSICYKFVDLGYLGTVAASGIVFPVTFFLADIVAEHYGYAANRVLIWSTLIAQGVFVSLVYLIYLMPNIDSNLKQIYFDHLFSNLFPRQILAASFCVFFAFFVFSFLISIIKANLQNKRFWKRTLIANITANAVLCFFSYVILYYNKYNFWFILKIIVDTWFIKMIIATLGTFIFTIPMIYFLKINDRKMYNYKNNYNPFKLELKLQLE